MSTELDPLQERADAEARAYAEALLAIDRLATFALPLEHQPDLPAQMQRLNVLWSSLPAVARRTSIIRRIGRTRPTRTSTGETRSSTRS